MIIMSHRGYWLSPLEKNQKSAFQRSFSLGFGTETDVRDHQGELVIAHDLPQGNEMLFSEFLSLLPTADLPLALNIKADGLAEKVQAAMKNYSPDAWFVFDMSIPDTRQQLKAGNPIFTRMSEIENEAIFIDQAAGIWLDAFNEDLWRLDKLNTLLEKNKKVCLVSPELHGRHPQPFWQALREQGFATHQQLMLCTDLPEEAQKFFL